MTDYCHRRIEIYSKNYGTWIDIPFEDLRPNDIFRIFDYNERYADIFTGNNIWIASGEPFLNKDKILTIDTLY